MNESTELRSSAATADDAAASTTDEVVRAEGLVKEFRGGDGGIIRVLDEVSLTVKRGEMVAIMGYSGAGKSTLLHVLGALERPSAGRIALGGQPIAALADDALAALRNRTVGFVFQFHHLLREFSAVENVMMPLRIAGTADDVARKRAEELLDRVGLSARRHHRPSELSGGSSNARRSRARWRLAPRSCLPTSRAATWICTTPNGCMTCLPNWRATCHWGWWW